MIIIGDFCEYLRVCVSLLIMASPRATPKVASRASASARPRELDWHLNFDRIDSYENRGEHIQTGENVEDESSLATALLTANTSKLTEERKVFLSYLERSLEEIGNAARSN